MQTSLQFMITTPSFFWSSGSNCNRRFKQESNETGRYAAASRASLGQLSAYTSVSTSPNTAPGTDPAGDGRMATRACIKGVSTVDPPKRRVSHPFTQQIRLSGWTGCIYALVARKRQGGHHALIRRRTAWRWQPRQVQRACVGGWVRRCGGCDARHCAAPKRGADAQTSLG